MLVNVIVVPTFSATEFVLVESVTVGAVSLSVIVIVTCWAPFSVAEPPDTLEIAITPVSSPS